VSLPVDIYLRVRAKLAELGFGDDYEWSENVKAPATADALCCEYTWVVLNSGMKNTVARGIMDRVWPALVTGKPIRDLFRHVGKVSAIEHVWGHRRDYFTCFNAILNGAQRSSSGEPWSDMAVGDAIVAWCESLPWIGKITKFHLAKNLGADVAKPDRWLIRLGAASGETVEELCSRLARKTGDRIATVDVVLWRACAVGVLIVDEDGIRLRGERRPR